MNDKKPIPKVNPPTKHNNSLDPKPAPKKPDTSTNKQGSNPKKK